MTKLKLRKSTLAFTGVTGAVLIAIGGIFLISSLQANNVVRENTTWDSHPSPTNAAIRAAQRFQERSQKNNDWFYVIKQATNQQTGEMDDNVLSPSLNVGTICDPNNINLNVGEYHNTTLIENESSGNCSVQSLIDEGTIDATVVPHLEWEVFTGCHMIIRKQLICHIKRSLVVLVSIGAIKLF